MALEKTKAIVLRVTAFSETSCIVTMMTREFGKVTAIAKGARRPKSPFEAALDVLAICRIVFLHKSSTAMDLLTEAKLERRFRSGATSLERLYAGYYVAELLNLLTDEADPHSDLYDLAVETIRAIDIVAPEDSAAFEMVDWATMNFELNALRSLGHLPMLTQCVSCGREKKTLNGVSFGMNAGGILCQACRPGERNVISLSSEGFEFLLEKMNQSGADFESNKLSYSSTVRGTLTACEQDQQSFRIGTRPISRKRTSKLKQRANPEVRSLLRNYITHLVGHPPRLQKFLNTNVRCNVVQSV